LIRTVGAIRNTDIIKVWVKSGDPFVLVGPEGCGKNLIIRNSFQELKQTQKITIIMISCNAQTRSSQVIQKLNQVCLKQTTVRGRVFKPNKCNRLVIYLKDINLPKPDEYQTIELIAFLQQVICHKGFYDHNLEFIHLDPKIQFIASMNPSSTIGRYELSSRFTANVRISYMNHPTNEELCYIYS